MTARRRKVAIASATIVVLLATAAGAALIFKLKGRGSSTGSAGITWSVAAGTNDEGTLNDPSGPGKTSPTRETFHIGSATIALVSGEMVLTANEVYSGYRTTWRGVANPTPLPLVIQRVVVTDTMNPAKARFTNEVRGYLMPSHCGKSLSTGSDGEVDVEVRWSDVPQSAAYEFRMDVETVPASQYVASSCVDWTAP